MPVVLTVSPMLSESAREMRHKTTSSMVVFMLTCGRNNRRKSILHYFDFFLKKAMGKTTNMQSIGGHWVQYLSRGGVGLG